MLYRVAYFGIYRSLVAVLSSPELYLLLSSIPLIPMCELYSPMSLGNIVTQSISPQLVPFDLHLLRRYFVLRIHVYRKELAVHLQIRPIWKSGT